MCQCVHRCVFSCACVCAQESESQRDNGAVGDVSPQQTSDQMPGRKLQLGSWRKSATLFIGLMGCHLQYNSQRRVLPNRGIREEH